MSQRTTERFHVLRSKDNEALTCYALGTRCETAEDVIAKADVDLSVWKIDSVDVRTYEVGMAVNESVEGVRVRTGAMVVPMMSIRVRLKRRAGAETLRARTFLNDLRELAPKRKALKRSSPEGDYLLEVSVPDFHLAARGVHGVRPAEDLYTWAVEQLLHQTRAYSVGRILFPVGNDFMHFDNLNAQTSYGTALENVDDSWHRAFARAKALLIWGVERLRKRAPVDVVVVPGNHDYQSSICLGHVLDAYYHSTPDVTVDVGPEHRHYYRWGETLLGFEHGNPRTMGRPGSHKYAAVMASEAPQDWAAATYREWHLGDQHRAARFEEVGVSLQFLPTLIGHDGWHESRGFIDHQRAALAFLYHRELGPVAQYRVNALTHPDLRQ